VRINRTIDDMKNQALHYVRSELSTIGALLARTTGQTDTIRNILRELEDGLAELSGITTDAVEDSGAAWHTPGVRERQRTKG
jgi:hypothetical protein